MSTLPEFLTELTKETSQLPASPHRTDLVHGLTSVYGKMQRKAQDGELSMSDVNAYLTRYEGELSAEEKAAQSEVIGRIDNLMIGWKEKLCDVAEGTQE